MTTIQSQIETLLTSGHTPSDVAAQLGLDYDADAETVLAPGWTADDGDAEIEYADAGSAREAAQDYVDGGDWGRDESTIWITVHTWRVGYRLDDEGEVETVRVDEDSHKIAVDPAEPECTESEHDWQAPHEIVGGLRGNPGVQGHGGGVILERVCMHCGCARTEDTWAQDPTDGEQGLDSVSYEAGRYSEELSALRAEATAND